MAVLTRKSKQFAPTKQEQPAVRKEEQRRSGVFCRGERFLGSRTRKEGEIFKLSTDFSSGRGVGGWVCFWAATGRKKKSRIG
ncbi:hypothetical protein SLEP1_g59618 [Rubroshorea leprosula]|uniref:Uncharacterized protein n=1 Tax=Rubroshorea leprosula TaxID=152421 RepID=A0AAV5MSW8_9ROSI|nr:hypothetical protein SLEP1_g59618 [Rubroshorea leprosula]